MIEVKILETKYLEFVEPSNNHYKFYRLTLLDNGKWLQQNGRIDTFGAKRVFSEYNDKNGYDAKFTEKLNQGYEIENDPNPHHIEQGLNHFGFTAMSDEDTMKNSAEEILGAEVIFANDESVEDKRKKESILNRIEIIKEQLSATENDHIFKEINKIDTFQKIYEIEKRVATGSFPKEDVKFMEDVWQRI